MVEDKALLKDKILCSLFSVFHVKYELRPALSYNINYLNFRT